VWNPAGGILLFVGRLCLDVSEDREDLRSGRRTEAPGYKASDPDDEDARDVTHDYRSNALFSLFAISPEPIGQAREILHAAVHEFADCELTVGGPLPDSIELALRNILVLLDRMSPAAGEAVRS
jgi:hypothetical protein